MPPNAGSNVLRICCSRVAARLLVNRGHFVFNTGWLQLNCMREILWLLLFSCDNAKSKVWHTKLTMLEM